jgi:DNA-binding MarR family transcriptional regulator
MAQLSDTQLVILNAAAQRDDLSIHPLPETLKIKGGAVHKVLTSLRNKGFIRVVESDGPERVVITSEGMAAIGIADEEDEEACEREAREAAAIREVEQVRARARAARTAASAATPAEADTAANGPASAEESDGAATGADGGGETADAKPAKAPTVRAGTEQALMIDLLKRPEGATVEQIAEQTGWQHHTIRGAISGALKKKLGLTIEATRTREVGPNKTGAKGSSTVYRIIEPA